MGQGEEVARQGGIRNQADVLNVKFTSHNLNATYTGVHSYIHGLLHDGL